MTEPWIITCETCQTKLRVRSAEAIGSILACPKCQSLVHVTPPEEPAETPSSSPAASEEADAGSWNTWPVKLMLASVGLAAIGVVGLLVAQRTSPDAVAETAGGVAAGARDAGAPHRDSAPPADREPLTADDTASREPSAPSGGQPTEGLHAGPHSPQDGGSGTGPEAAPALPELPRGSQQESADRRRAPNEDRQPESAVPRIGLSQFDLDFGTQPPPPTEAGKQTHSTDNVLREDPTQASDAAAPAVPASSGPRMAVERLDTGDASQRVADPGQALSLPVGGLEIGGASEWSPVEFVRLIADMTGTAITFTPEAYVELRRRSSGPFTATYRDATAGEVLTDLLKRNGLTVDQRGKHLVIAPLGDGVGRSGVVRGPDELPPQGRLAGTLRQQVTFSFTQPAPLSEVLRHVERTAGITLLVDWESLAAVGLNPRTSITTSVVDQPLLDVLNALLPQLDLRWSAVGDDAVWLSVGRQGS